MQIVSVIAQKGGAGKTTLSLAIACAAAAEGLSAVVVDLDPQATAASWGDRRDADNPVVIPAQPPRLVRILEAAASQGVDLAVVDTAPRVEQSAVAAARTADLVLVPCRPAVYDLETVAATRDLVRAVAPDAPLLCVLNGVPSRGRAGRGLVIGRIRHIGKGVPARARTPGRHRRAGLRIRPRPARRHRLRGRRRHERPRERAARQGRRRNRHRLRQHPPAGRLADRLDRQLAG